MSQKPEKQSCLDLEVIRTRREPGYNDYHVQMPLTDQLLGRLTETQWDAYRVKDGEFTAK